MDKRIIGQRIREQRKAKKLTLEALSEMADIGLVYLGEIERGVKLPSLNTFIKLVNSLGISADALLWDEVDSSKGYRLNQLTQRLDKLPPRQLRAVASILDAVIDGFEDIKE